MRNTTVFRLALDSTMAGLYFVLATYCSIHMGNLILSVASIALVLVSLLYSPADALSVALIGGLLNQTFSEYGLGPTTVLWLIPILLRAGIISLTAMVFRKRGTYLEKHYVAYFVTLFVAAVVTTASNTGVIYLDAWLLNYPATYTIIQTIFRFLSGMITSVVIALLCLPIMKGLNHIDIGRVKCKEISSES